MIHHELLIGGAFFGGPCDQGIGKLVSRDPYTDAVVGTAAEGGWPEMDAALDAAQAAFGSWRGTSPAERSRLLACIAEFVRARHAELTGLLVAEVGKPIVWARSEVDRLAITFDLAAAHHDEDQRLDLGADPRGAHYDCTVRQVPVGVVVAVTPYNWPFNLAAHKIAPALAMGNTVVLKPSPLSPLCSLALARLIHEAGCPPGVVNAVVCDAKTAERAVTDPRTALVSFTGSEPVGWHIKSLVPEKRVVLELGGDASVLVMHDADLDWAVERTVLGKFGYAGQICISVQHARVHQRVYDEFRTRLLERVDSLKVSDPRDEETICGPVITEASATRIQAMVDEAVSAGAVLLCGGGSSGTHVEPTVLEGVPTNCALATEEVFGPVLTLSRFDDIDQAVALVNASRFGIHCGLFTNDQTVIDRCFRDLDVASLIVNDSPATRFDAMPYGGNKKSGFGREGIAWACEEMSTPKVKLVRTKF